MRVLRQSTTAPVPSNIHNVPDQTSIAESPISWNVNVPVGSPSSPEGNLDADGMTMKFPSDGVVAAGLFPDITMNFIVPTAALPSVARHVLFVVVCDVVTKVNGVVVSMIRVSSSELNAIT